MKGKSHITKGILALICIILFISNNYALSETRNLSIGTDVGFPFLKNKNYKSGIAAFAGINGIENNTKALGPLPPTQADLLASNGTIEATICSGDSEVLTVTTDAIPGAIYTWYKNDLPIGPGVADQSTFTATESGGYYVLISNDPSSIDAEISSNVVTVTVNSTPLPPSINNPGPVCEGGTIYLSASGISSASYKWTGAYTSTSQSISRTPATLSMGGIYYVTQTVDGCTSIPASTVLEVVANITPTVSITATPTNICSGDLVTFSVDNEFGQGVNPTYQWYQKNIEVGGNSPFFSTNGLGDQDEVRLVMYPSESCLQPDSAVSNTIIVTVSSSVNPSVSIGISGGGTSEVCQGEQVSFEVTGSVGAGSNPSYQWKVGGVDAVNGTNSAFTLNDPENGDEVSVEMTDLSICASPQSATSLPITLTVLPRETPEVTIMATPAGIVCPGVPITFEVANVSGAGTLPTYQWMRNNNLANDETGLSYIVSDLSNGEEVSVEVTGSGLCRSKTKDTSNVLSPLIGSSPIVQVTGLKSDLCPGEILTLTANASGGSGFSYSWKRNSIDEGVNSASHEVAHAGDYIVVVTNSFNCTSTSPIYTVTEFDLIPATISPANQTICQGETGMITASPSNGSYSYTWINQSDAIVASGETYFPASAGEYRVVIDYGTCIDTSDLNGLITVEAPLTPIISGNFTPTCNSQEFYTVPYSLGSSYDWILPSDATIIDGQGTSTITVQFGTGNGIIEVVESTSNGCVSSPGQMNISLQGCSVQPDFQASTTDPCQNETVIFTNFTTGASGSAIYSWNFGAGASPSTATGFGPHAVTYTMIGSSTVSLTVTDGVTREERKPDYLNVQPLPSIVEISGPSSVCTNSDATFLVSNQSGYSYSWNATGGTLISGQYSPSINVNFPTSGSGTIALDYQNNCGFGSISKDVQIIQSGNIEIKSSASTICNGSPVIFSIASPLSGEYTWMRDGQLISGANTSTYSTNISGNYQVQVNGNCSGLSNSIYIQKSDFQVNLGGDKIVEKGSSVSLMPIGSEAISAFVWQPAYIQNVLAPIVSPQATSQYIITATGVSGCSDIDTLEVKVVSPLVIPNAFTPNADGIHDVWRIDGLERFDNYKLEIFNRWGNLVYSTTDLRNGWNGNHNGSILPVSTYYFVLTVTLNGQMSSESGSILLSK